MYSFLVLRSHLSLIRVFRLLVRMYFVDAEMKVWYSCLGFLAWDEIGGGQSVTPYLR